MNNVNELGEAKEFLTALINIIILFYSIDIKLNINKHHLFLVGFFDNLLFLC